MHAMYVNTLKTLIIHLAKDNVTLSEDDATLSEVITCG